MRSRPERNMPVHTPSRLLDGMDRRSGDGLRMASRVSVGGGGGGGDWVVNVSRISL